MGESSRSAQHQRSRVLSGVLTAGVSMSLILHAAASSAAAASPPLVAAVSSVASLEVVSASLPTDLPITATVYGFDSNGDPLGDVTSQVTLSIAPDGSCSGERCYGTSAGAHTVTAVYGSGAGRVVGTGTWTLFPGPATTLEIASGNHQSAGRGTAFPVAVSVRVSDSDGDALGGYLVQWRVTKGSASFAGGTGRAQSLTSSASGVAVAPRLIAGSSSGPVTVTASINGLSAHVDLLTYATPLTVSVAAGNHQLAEVGRRFATALRAVVTDAAHQRLAGVRVTWRVSAGPARFTGGVLQTRSTTAANGQAVAPVLVAGRSTGTIVVTASVTGGRSASYRLVAGLAPSVTSVTSKTFTVGVADRFTITAAGFPRPHISLRGSLPAGLAFVDDGDGTATVSGTAQPGTEGSYHLLVDVANGVADPQASLTLTVVDAANATSAERGDLALTGANAAQDARAGLALLLAGALLVLAGRRPRSSTTATPGDPD